MRAKSLLAAGLVIFPAAAGADSNCGNLLLPGWFFNQALSLGDEGDAPGSGPFFFHPVKLFNHRDRQVIYRGNLEDLYHQKTGGVTSRKISFRNHRAELLWPPGEKLLNAGVAAGFFEEDFGLKLPSLPDYAIDLESRKTVGQLVLTKEILPRLLKVGFGSRITRIAEKRLWDFSEEVVFSWYEILRLGWAHRKLNTNQLLEISYEEAFMDLPLNVVWRQNDYHFDFEPSPNLRLEFNYQNSRLKENQALSRQTDFFLQPTGRLSSFSGRLEARLPSGLGLHIVQRKNYFLDLSADLFYRGQKFAKVTRLKRVDESILVGTSVDVKGSHHFSPELEFVKIAGETRGHLETWPFTPTLLDLLGNRLYFRLDGEVKIFRTGLQYEKDEWLSFGLKGRLDYLTLRPSGEAQTWNPVFLVFGVRNLKNTSLDIRRVDLLLLRLGLSREINNLSFEYHFSQFLPLYKRAGGGISDPSKGSGGPAGSVKKSSGGGTIHNLSLSYRIP